MVLLMLSVKAGESGSCHCASLFMIQSMTQGPMDPGLSVMIWHTDSVPMLGIPLGRAGSRMTLLASKETYCFSPVAAVGRTTPRRRMKTTRTRRAKTDMSYFCV